MDGLKEGKFYIVIATHGWVYVGRVFKAGKWLLMRDACNLGRWETTHGIGELAHGPKEGTGIHPRADGSGMNSIAVIEFIPCTQEGAEKWFAAITKENAKMGMEASK